MPPKIECLQTVPAGAWGGHVDALADRYLSAQDTYLSSTAPGGTNSLIAAFQALLVLDVPGTTVTLQSNGTVLITWGSGSRSYTWASTTFRNRLGFTGNLASATSHTGTRQAMGLFLPNHGASELLGSVNSRGAREDDRVQQRARSGKMYTTIFNRYTVQRFAFAGLTKAKVWEEDESLVNESAESLWVDFLSAGTPFRYYTDASIASSYQTPLGNPRDYVYAAEGFQPRRMQASYDGSWEWAFDARLSV